MLLFNLFVPPNVCVNIAKFAKSLSEMQVCHDIININVN